MRLALPTLLPVTVLAVLAMPAHSAAVTKQPQPELGRKFVVALVSGDVFVKTPGAARASRLRGRRTIPVGTTVNATKGRVKLVGAMTKVQRAKGKFSQGAFIATQARRKRAVIDLELTGGRFADCGQARTSGARRRIGRKLRGNARGNYRTRGRHSAATIRGTKWVTEDTCSSTIVKAEEGVVETNLAQQDAAFELDDGDIFEAICDPPIGSNQPLRFCIATLNNVEQGLFAVGIGTYVHVGTYDLCIFAPDYVQYPDGSNNGRFVCRNQEPFPEPPPGESFRISVLGCAPDAGPGFYTVAWYYQNQLFGYMYVNVVNPFAPGTGFCPVGFEDLQRPLSRRSRSSSARAARNLARPRGASAPSATPPRG